LGRPQGGALLGVSCVEIEDACEKGEEVPQVPQKRYLLRKSQNSQELKYSDIVNTLYKYNEEHSVFTLHGLR